MIRHHRQQPHASACTGSHMRAKCREIWVSPTPSLGSIDARFHDWEPRRASTRLDIWGRGSSRGSCRRRGAARGDRHEPPAARRCPGPCCDGPECLPRWGFAAEQLRKQESGVHFFCMGCRRDERTGPLRRRRRVRYPGSRRQGAGSSRSSWPCPYTTRPCHSRSVPLGPSDWLVLSRIVQAQPPDGDGFF